MKPEDQKRIGRRNKGIVSQWPELSISGRDYGKPCTQIGLGDGQHFVVEDLFPEAGYVAEIDKLKEVVEGVSAPPKVKPKVKPDES